MPYAVADARQKFRIASENPAKTDVVRDLLARHPGQPTLIIGMYVEQIRGIAEELDVPVMTGSTSQRKRDALFEDFKAGRLDVLAVSKVANFAVDLPDASVAIQISGTFGSRQEEAQRLGRILRPKAGREPGPLLHGRQSRYGRTGFRPEATVVPLRTGLRLRDSRRG